MANLNVQLAIKSNTALSDATDISVTNDIKSSGDVALQRIAVSSSGKLVLSSAEYGKSYVYVLNTDTTLDITLESAASGGTVFMDLAPGEIGYFPWNGTADIYGVAASGTPVLEIAIFEA